MTRARLGWLVLAFALANTHCAHYRWVGAGTWATGTTLSVMPPKEETPLGMAADVAQGIGDILGAAGVSLSRTEGAADYRLTATLAVQNRPRLGGQGVQLFELEGRLFGVVHDRNGRTVWEQSIWASDVYFPSDPSLDAQPLVTETSRRTALRRLAETLGRKLGGALLTAPLPSLGSPS